MEPDFVENSFSNLGIDDPLSEEDDGDGCPSSTPRTTGLANKVSRTDGPPKTSIALRTPVSALRRRSVRSAVPIMATGDVKYWDNSYGKTLDELDGLITTAEAGGDGRQEAISDATKSLKRLAGMRRSYNLEIKLLKDTASKAHYNLEKSKKDARLAELQSKFDFVQRAEQARRVVRGPERRRERGDDGKIGGGGVGRGRPVRGQDGGGVQDGSARIKTQNIIGVLQETEATADGTAVELTNQREQLIRIDMILKRSDRRVKVLAKRMMTDKFIQCFGCLDVAALVAIVIYLVVRNVDLPGGDDAEPPDPTT